jgi:hypothetical protein
MDVATFLTLSDPQPVTLFPISKNTKAELGSQLENEAACRSTRKRPKNSFSYSPWTSFNIAVVVNGL